jgi:uncharacterized membrane protein
MYLENNDPTKNIYIYSFVSLLLIVIFMLTPLNNYYNLSFFMKIIISLILGYTFYLNTLQIKNFYSSSFNPNNEMYKKYKNANIFFSYIFSLLLFVLLCFILKSFWF